MAPAKEGAHGHRKTPPARGDAAGAARLRHVLASQGAAKEIIGEIQKALDELPHHRGLVVTSAGVMPPLCRPETIREVCERVKAYDPRM